MSVIPTNISPVGVTYRQDSPAPRQTRPFAWEPYLSLWYVYLQEERALILLTVTRTTVGKLRAGVVSSYKRCRNATFYFSTVGSIKEDIINPFT